MIGVDTNILVYAHRAAAPEHQAARRALERASTDRRGWGFTVASISEFWRIVTHPSNTERPSSGPEASRFILTLLDHAGAELWQPGPVFGRRLLQLATERQVEGSHIYDLQIALTAFDNGATEIWSHDRDFTSVPGLPLRDPLSPPS